MNHRSVINGDYRIISLLCGLGGYYKRRYVYPSQEWLLANLTKYYGRSMSRSTLCRHMAALERDGYLKRTKRHTYSPTLGILFRSTLYQITRKALRFAAAMANFVGLGHKKSKHNKTNKPCATSATISLPSIKDYSRDPGISGSPTKIQPGKDQMKKIIKDLRDKLRK